MGNCFIGKYKVTSPYGMRSSEMHWGIDLVGIDDKTVYAPCDGIIGSSAIISKENDPGSTWEWGNYVRIDTADGKYWVYLCHLALRSVVKGQKVKKGDKIGIMGNTGKSDGAHTHFEVRKKGTSTRVNPADVFDIPNKKGEYTTVRTLAENCAILNKHGIMKTPQYWIDNARKLPYLEELIANMAEVLK